MITDKFILTTDQLRQNEGAIIIEFKDDVLHSISFQYAIAADHIDWWKKWLPTNKEELGAIYTELKKHGKKPDLKLVPNDLSFTRFWSEYGNKAGKKKYTENLWNKLPEREQIKALNYLPIYRTYLAKNVGITQKYASSYLNAAEWNN